MERHRWRSRSKSFMCYRSCIHWRRCLREYKESLVLELEKKSVLEDSMFEQAELHFEGEKIVCVEL